MQVDASYSARPITMSIAAVERDTGLSKDTLRVWERRYGFPLPTRDSMGERSYPVEQVERLRTIKRLLDAGHRPGRVVAMAHADLDRLTTASGVGAAPPQRSIDPIDTPDLTGFMAAIRQHDVETLRQLMARAIARMGLGRFVLDVVSVLNVQVGDEWMQGRLEVFEEHLYTESVQVVLRGALQQRMTAEAGRPRVLLATVPGEPHGLGVLMAEAIFALEGCRCTSLGVQTPVWDIVRAAMALDSDVVALSYTGCTNPHQVTDGLTEMRSKLPPGVGLWAGGRAPVLKRRAIDGVQVLTSLSDVAQALAEWREHNLARADPSGEHHL
jgi:DNA-binding transcriptional MerR regulator/methylmalonyl-CoA mutase cobalamin-binding subunit